MSDLPIPAALKRGNLAEWPLAGLLVAAQRTGATGVLRLRSPDGVASVFFRDGLAAGAAGTLGYAPLGQVILEEGLIQTEELVGAT